LNADPSGGTFSVVTNAENHDRAAGGLCPACGQPGAVGQPCGEQICGRRGYCFVPSDHAPRNGDTPDPLVGVRIGDYLVVDVIGAGGFGRVYLGLQLPILMKAAIKLLAVDRLPDRIARVAPGGCPPGAPTDPDVRVSASGSSGHGFAARQETTCTAQGDGSG